MGVTSLPLLSSFLHNASSIHSCTHTHTNTHTQRTHVLTHSLTLSQDCGCGGIHSVSVCMILGKLFQSSQSPAIPALSQPQLSPQQCLFDKESAQPSFHPPQVLHYSPGQIFEFFPSFPITQSKPL